MFDFGCTDTECKGTKGSVRYMSAWSERRNKGRTGSVGITTNDCGTGKSESLLRTDNVDDTYYKHTDRSTG